MNADLAEIASLFLATYGSKQDLDLMEQVIKECPYVARDVSEKFKILKNRLE